MMSRGISRPTARSFLACAIAVGLAWSAALPAPAKNAASSAALTAEQIVAKNVTARGGLEAWRKIQTMVWVGRMQVPSAPIPGMRFVLEEKRPNKTRFELTSLTEHSMRVFDGTGGWKIRPGRQGRSVTPYTEQEISFARGEQVIDGPLIDYKAKGNTVTLQGIEEVEGRKAYRLNVRLASGQRQDIWVDAQTFLDVRMDRLSYNTAGAPRIVPVYYRDFKPFEGLQIPTTIETGVGSGSPTNKMEIERITVNPPLEDRVFAPPVESRKPNTVSNPAVAAQQP